ncbi:MAG TPA: YHS domain-containing protein [Pirellulales bacterium]|jgi:YHS domain-containing protein|nr:YHS domain-containing protein [Pirellulales bacterium]
MKRIGGWILRGACLLLLGPIVRLSGAADKPAVKQESVAADKKALAPFQPYIGEWKGVGQPRRGSSQGAWSEEAGWAWHFTDKHAELTAQVSHDPYFSALRLQLGDQPGRLRLIGTTDGKDDVPFDGTVGTDGPLVLTAAGETKPDQPARVTMRLVAGGDRLVVLYERRSGEQFARMAEIGYTRKGSSFAVTGGDPHECIVTGGHGTIAVEYKGQTYYFCCTGCRDLFKQDPEAVLAEYRERKAKEHTADKNP